MRARPSPRPHNVPRRPWVPRGRPRSSSAACRAAGEEASRSPAAGGGPTPQSYTRASADRRRARHPPLQDLPRARGHIPPGPGAVQPDLPGCRGARELPTGSGLRLKQHSLLRSAGHARGNGLLRGRSFELRESNRGVIRIPPGCGVKQHPVSKNRSASGVSF